jgi:hypothetical protein
LQVQLATQTLAVVVEVVDIHHHLPLAKVVAPAVQDLLLSKYLQHKIMLQYFITQGNGLFPMA